MRILAAAIVLFLTLEARAQAQAASSLSGADYLTLEEVLSSSATHFPAILESLAARRAAAGRVTQADGAFDLVFSADGFSRATGFWDGSVLNTQVSRNLRPLGAKVYGGYRLSDGDFPIYEDVNFTNTGGEAKIGALFSLLRDRAIDDRRFGTLDARLALKQADFEVLLTKIGVQHKALAAYWRWVAAGRQLQVYEELLEIAEGREAGLEEQVRQGARAAIFITENRQNITRRQRLVLEARRDFQNAANALSFYYRDAAGTPAIPEPALLPPESVGSVDPAQQTAEAGDAILRALAARPELAILRAAIDRARAKTDLARNDLKPQLDLTAELSRDFGSVAEGGISRDSTDAIVGFRFSVPLQRREARGRAQSAEAEYEAALQRRRQTLEQIELEVRNILIDLGAARKLVRIAEQELTQSETMERAERTRFAGGASDFFLVNVREETAADARIQKIRAELESQIAQANFYAATVNLPKLGLNAD